MSRGCGACFSDAVKLCGQREIISSQPRAPTESQDHPCLVGLTPLSARRKLAPGHFQPRDHRGKEQSSVGLWRAELDIPRTRRGVLRSRSPWEAFWARLSGAAAASFPSGGASAVRWGQTALPAISLGSAPSAADLRALQWPKRGLVFCVTFITARELRAAGDTVTAPSL